MARTGLAQDERFAQHQTGADHAERPQRLECIAAALDERGLSDSCAAVAVGAVDMTLVEAVHTEDYVARLRKACSEGESFIDVPDSAICPASFEVARLAVGAAVQAVDDVMARRIDNAFCAVRPPGHHAERDASMGFCLFNNVAIAARRLLNHHGLDRVVVLDWDVHHCNGTQHIFEDDPRVLVISLHGHPGVVYPGTGFAEERGSGDGEGYTLNIPMLPPSGDAAYRRAFDEQVLPAIDTFAPEFVLLSAGFDAHRLDPLAPLELETESFAWMTDAMTAAAAQHCEGRLVSLLEGGYHVDALADSVCVHVARLLEA